MRGSGPGRWLRLWRRWSFCLRRCWALLWGGEPLALVSDMADERLGGTRLSFIPGEAHLVPGGATSSDVSAVLGSESEEQEARETSGSVSTFDILHYSTSSLLSRVGSWQSDGSTTDGELVLQGYSEGSVQAPRDLLVANSRGDRLSNAVRTEFARSSGSCTSCSSISWHASPTWLHAWLLVVGVGLAVLVSARGWGETEGVRMAAVLGGWACAGVLVVTQYAAFVAWSPRAFVVPLPKDVAWRSSFANAVALSARTAELVQLAGLALLVHPPSWGAGAGLHQVLESISGGSARPRGTGLVLLLTGLGVWWLLGVGFVLFSVAVLGARGARLPLSWRAFSWRRSWLWLGPRLVGVVPLLASFVAPAAVQGGLVPLLRLCALGADWEVDGRVSATVLLAAGVLLALSASSVGLYLRMAAPPTLTERLVPHVIVVEVVGKLAGVLALTYAPAGTAWAPGVMLAVAGCGVVAHSVSQAAVQLTARMRWLSVVGYGCVCWAALVSLLGAAGAVDVSTQLFGLVLVGGWAACGLGLVVLVCGRIVRGLWRRRRARRARATLRRRRRPANGRSAAIS